LKRRAARLILFDLEIYRRLLTAVTLNLVLNGLSFIERCQPLVKVSTMRGFQDSTLKVFCELGDALATRINEFGDGLRQIFVVRIQSVAPQYSMRSGVAVGDAGCQREVLSI
jgi:hypothetical protein